MQLHLADAAATEALGAALVRVLADCPGAVIFLEGDLGAGKTTLARGLLRELGVQGTIKSPTYTLMEPYQARGRSVLHMDFYRLNDPLELHNLGLADFPPQRTLWLVEWPQYGAGLLPPPDLRLNLRTQGAARIAEMQLRPGFGDGFCSDLQKELRPI